MGQAKHKQKPNKNGRLELSHALLLRIIGSNRAGIGQAIVHGASQRKSFSCAIQELSRCWRRASAVLGMVEASREKISGGSQSRGPPPVFNTSPPRQKIVSVATLPPLPPPPPRPPHPPPPPPS